MRNILAHVLCLLLVVAITGCERPEYRLESVQDGKRVLGILVNSEGEYEFALCPKEAFTRSSYGLSSHCPEDPISGKPDSECIRRVLRVGYKIDYSQCLNPLVDSDGSPKTFSAIPSKPNTVGAKIQTGVIITATAIVAAGVAYWIGRYFTTIKASKTLGANLFVEKMGLAMAALRSMDNIKIPKRMGKRLLNEDGLLKEEIRIALKHDYTLKTLKLKDGTILTNQKAIDDEIISWGTTRVDLVRDIGNLHKKTKFNDKPWGRELADSLAGSRENGGDIHTIIEAEGMTKELYNTLHKNDLVIREIDGAFRFEEKIINKIRSYETLTADELEQLKEVTSALSARKKLVTKVKKAAEITGDELNKTDKALSGLDGAKADDSLMALVKTSGIGGDDVEKIDDLLVSELREFKRYLKDVRAHTADKGTIAQLQTLEKQVDDEIKSSARLYVMKNTLKKKNAIKEGMKGDEDYARESILSSGEVASKEGSFTTRFATALRDTFKYKDANGKFTTAAVAHHDELVASLAKGEQFGKIKIDSGALKATSQLVGAGMFLSLATFKSNILPKYTLLEASKYWDALVGEFSPSGAPHTDDLYSVIKGLAIATESKVSDRVQYFFLHTGTEGADTDREREE